MILEMWRLTKITCEGSGHDQPLRSGDAESGRGWGLRGTAKPFRGDQDQKSLKEGVLSVKHPTGIGFPVGMRGLQW